MTGEHLKPADLTSDQDRKVIDYLDTPPKRYHIVAARNERGIIQLERADGEWVKFRDMDIYMFEGAQLMNQSIERHQRLIKGIKALQLSCCGDESPFCNGCRALLELAK